MTGWRHRRFKHSSSAHCWSKMYLHITNIIKEIKKKRISKLVLYRICTFCTSYTKIPAFRQYVFSYNPLECENAIDKIKIGYNNVPCCTQHASYFVGTFILMCKLHSDCVWFVSYYTCFSQAYKPLGCTPTSFNNTV